MKNLPLIALSGILIAGCTSDPTQVSVGGSTGDVNEVHTIPVAMPEGGKIVHPAHGPEEFFAYGAMTGVEGTAANGVVQLQEFEDKTSILTLQLNIEQAPEGTFYSAAAVNASDRMELGQLQNLFGDVRHQIESVQQVALRNFMSIEVSLNGEIVARGSLREVKR